MAKVRLKIGDGDGSPKYMDEEYGLVYLSSDNRVSADAKDFESVSYPEEDGEHVFPVTVDAAFDYTVKFYVRCGSHGANGNIAAFNARLYDKDEDGVKTLKRVYLYNDCKGVLIVGYPKPISNAPTFLGGMPGGRDFVIVEWTIHVDDPGLCDFNLDTEA